MSSARTQALDGGDHSGRCWVRGVTFGELTMSPDLYTELVHEIGVRRLVPEEASTPDEYKTAPTEREDEHWAQLLSGDEEYEGQDDPDIRF